MAFQIDRVAIAIIVRKMAMLTMAIMNEISMIIVAIINANRLKTIMSNIITLATITNMI